MSKYLKFVLASLMLLSFVLAGIGYQPSIIKAAPNYADGTLIKPPDSDRVWLVNNGHAVLIRSAKVFNDCGYDWNKIITNSDFYQIPAASLIKGSDKPDVYVLSNFNKRKLASVEIFNAHVDTRSWLGWDKIATVSCRAIMDSFSYTSLMKTEDSDVVWRVRSDFVRHQYTSMQAFSNDGMQTKDIVKVNQIELDSYTAGAAIGAIENLATPIIFWPIDGATAYSSNVLISVWGVPRDNILHYGRWKGDKVLFGQDFDVWGIISYKKGTTNQKTPVDDTIDWNSSRTMVVQICTDETLSQCSEWSEPATYTLKPAEEYTESDQGIDYTTKGAIKPKDVFLFKAEEMSDECVYEIQKDSQDRNTLIEYYLTGDPDSPVDIEKYTCPHGCQDGTCIQG